MAAAAPAPAHRSDSVSRSNAKVSGYSPAAHSAGSTERSNIAKPTEGPGAERPANAPLPTTSTTSR
eukprot:CAMPEP_0197612736 /NCGR_PEP_ID=MMETSP1326-20131121/57852_1 /TAXON_ID=1155430 /ORGANISM="Genus nov. species nov., Strain RCC2288" /LENGTH=65 /DNA_ID=CAMNT_0043181523 /DNA_START=69 /DNA_END=263 /DNA_ORIENTATION=+